MGRREFRSRMIAERQMAGRELLFGAEYQHVRNGLSFRNGVFHHYRIKVFCVNLGLY